MANFDGFSTKLPAQLWHLQTQSKLTELGLSSYINGNIIQILLAS